MKPLPRNLASHGEPPYLHLVIRRASTLGLSIYHMTSALDHSKTLQISIHSYPLCWFDSPQDLRSIKYRKLDPLIAKVEEGIVTKDVDICFIFQAYFLYKISRHADPWDPYIGWRTHESSSPRYLRPLQTRFKSHHCLVVDVWDTQVQKPGHHLNQRHFKPWRDGTKKSGGNARLH